MCVTCKLKGQAIDDKEARFFCIHADDLKLCKPCFYRFAKITYGEEIAAMLQNERENEGQTLKG